MPVPDPTLYPLTWFDPLLAAYKNSPPGVMASETGLVPAGKGEPLTSFNNPGSRGTVIRNYCTGTEGTYIA